MNPKISQEQKEKRREQILMTAAELLVKKGYDNTSVSDIAKAAGIAQGTFYLYFTSKEGILMALVEAFSEKLLHTAFANAAAVTSPLARIETAIATIVSSAMEQKDFVGLLHSGTAAGVLSDPDKMIENWNMMIAPLVEWIREGITLGEIREQDERLVAYFVVTLVHEVMERAIMMEYPASVVEVLPTLQAFVRNALKA